MADPTILTLTSAQEYQADYRPFSTPVDASRGLSITFDFYAYGGNGGDGIGFFLINGSSFPTQPGGFGGSLGYAPRIDRPGIDGGYLGIGFDAFGNFANPTEGRLGGPGMRKNSVGVRGSQGTGYTFLGQPFTLPIRLDNQTAGATRANSKRTANITINLQGDLSISIDLNNDGDTVDTGLTFDLNLNGVVDVNETFSEKIIQFNVVQAGNGALPSTLRFGFAASTGSATNIHEVGNFDVRTLDGTIIPGNFTQDQVIGGGDSSSGNSGTPGGDPITGANGNDVLISDSITQRDILTGGLGADRFVFSGINKRQALKTSTLNRLDRVVDFRFSQGDRFSLDFDNNLATLANVEKPKRIFNAGKLEGSLKNAVEQAYEDKNFKQKNDQALKANEAVFFQRGRRTYLSVNDAKGSFSARNDLLVDVTGIQFKRGDLNKGSLAIANYFAVEPIF